MGRAIICLLMIFPMLIWAAPKSRDLEAEFDQGDSISRGRYITGGVIGSTVGFGVGHGIQKRYRGHAWIFTAGESAAVAYFWLNSIFPCDGQTGSQYDSCMDDVNRRRTIAALTLLAFRVWETIDVWTGVRVSPSRVALVPAMVSSSAPGVLLAVQF